MSAGKTQNLYRPLAHLQANLAAQQAITKREEAINIAPGFAPKKLAGTTHGCVLDVLQSHFHLMSRIP